MSALSFMCLAINVFEALGTHVLASIDNRLGGDCDAGGRGRRVPDALGFDPVDVTR
jgi:hypothetical protein